MPFWCSFLHANLVIYHSNIPFFDSICINWFGIRRLPYYKLMLFTILMCIYLNGAWCPIRWSDHIRPPHTLASHRAKPMDASATAYLGLVHMGSQVPSPTHVSKSQHGGKVPTFEPQETIDIWLTIIKVRSSLFHANIFVGLGLRVGSSILLNTILNTSLKPRLQNMLPCRHPCQTWDPV